MARLVVVFLLAACELDLDTKLDLSRNRVQRYSDELYWQAEHIGYIKPNKSINVKNRMENLLKSRNLWKEKTSKTSKGMILRTHIKMGYDLYTKQNKKVLYYSSMELPNYEGYISYYFYYNYETGVLTPLFTSSSRVTNSLHITVIENKEAFNISDQRASQSTFARNREKTLQREIVPEKDNSTGNNYIHSGITSYIYSFSHWVPDVNSKLKNTVKPIVLGYIDAGISFPGYFFNARYETDFGYRGGDVKSGREAKDTFNLNDTASYLLKTAAGYNGVEVSYLTEHYQFGDSTYTYKELVGDTYVSREEKIKFESKRRQIDLKYHIGWRNIPKLGGTNKRKQIWDFYFGYRYANISTLKIIYTTSNEAGEEPIVIAESNPQLLESFHHLVGFGTNNLLMRNKGLSYLFGFELYAGGGHTNGKLYGLTYDDEYIKASDVQKNNTETLYLITIVMGGTLGVSYDANIAGADISFIARYDPTAYANSSDFVQGHGNSNFYSNDGDIYNKLSVGLSVHF